METLDAALADFGAALRESGDSVGPVIGRGRAQTLGFWRSPDPEQDTHMVDLGLLVGEIGKQALDVSDQADEVIRALSDTVVDKVDGQATRGATGLSIYFPPSRQYYNTAYDLVASATSWSQFLAGYYEVGQVIPEELQPSFLSDEAELSFDEDGVNIVASFDPAITENLAEATISYGIVEDDGSITFIGDEPAEIADDGSGTAVAMYDLTVLTLSDGEDTTYAYLSLGIFEDEGTATIDVPMAYYSPDDIGGETYQEVLLTLTVDIESGDIINEIYYAYNEQQETYGELTADPEGIIVPEVLMVDAEGQPELGSDQRHRSLRRPAEPAVRPGRPRTRDATPPGAVGDRLRRQQRGRWR